MSETSPGGGQAPPSMSGGAPAQASHQQGDQQSSGRRSHRGNRGGQRQHRAPTFTGKEEKLKGFIYDVSTHKSTRVFSKTTKEIAEYAAREYTSAGEFRHALQNLEYDVLAPPAYSPADAANPTVPEQELFKLEYKSYFDKKTKREENQKKIYALVLGQCTQAMVDRLESSSEYEAVDASNDPVELLKLIRACIYQKTVTKKPVHAFIDAEMA